MNRAQSDAHGSGVPSLSHHWMAALLRLIAMLVSSAACPLRVSRLARACHTDVTPARLPAMEDGTQAKETETAEANSHTLQGLMLSGGEAGVSTHAARLTNRAASHPAASAMLLSLQGGGASTADGGTGRIRRGSLSPAHAGRDTLLILPFHRPSP